MKKGIHPNYHMISVQLNDGTTYKTRSTWGEPGQKLTLDIDPIPADVRETVETLARGVGLDVATLDQPASGLSRLDRMRLHLARALAVGPQALLLEHPTASLDPAGSRAFGEALRQVADARALAWIAFANDPAFAEAAGGRRGTLNFETGEWIESAPGFWRRILPTVFR